MKKIVFVLLSIALLGFAPVARAAPASAPVPLDSWVYPALDKLAGLGMITSSIQGMRPITRLEAARQVREAEEYRTAQGAPAVVGELLTRLERELDTELERLHEPGLEKSFFQPLRSAEFTYVYRDGDDAFYPGTNARQFPLNFNNYGIDYGEGHNAQLTFESEANLGGWLSLSARPLYEVQEEGANGSLHLLEGRAAVGLGPFEFSAGRQPLWWGPGRHGSLVLSNNAKPLDMLRVTIPSPVLLPWLFRYLGPFRFDLFVSELEQDRALSEPYFGGLRLDFKPLPWLELGASRAVIFGGGDQDLSFDDFLTIIGGENLSGDEDTSNSVAALDARVRIPALWGAEFYGELGGEDEAGGFISNKAWLAGLYLPQVEPSGRASLRIEYADLSHIDDNSGLWYRHGIYKSGYTYEKKILGHHVGGAAEDLFVQIDVLLPWDLDLSLEFDYEKRGVDQKVEEKHYQPAVELAWVLRDSWRLTGRYAYDQVDNFAFEPDEERDLHFADLSLRYAW